MVKVSIPKIDSPKVNAPKVEAPKADVSGSVNTPKLEATPPQLDISAHIDNIKQNAPILQETLRAEIDPAVQDGVVQTFMYATVKPALDAVGWKEFDDFETSRVDIDYEEKFINDLTDNQQQVYVAYKDYVETPAYNEAIKNSQFSDFTDNADVARLNEFNTRSNYASRIDSEHTDSAYQRLIDPNDPSRITADPFENFNFLARRNSESTIPRDKVSTDFMKKASIYLTAAYSNKRVQRKVLDQFTRTYGDDGKVVVDPNIDQTKIDGATAEVDAIADAVKIRDKMLRAVEIIADSNSTKELRDKATAYLKENANKNTDMSKMYHDLANKLGIDRPTIQVNKGGHLFNAKTLAVRARAMQFTMFNGKIGNLYEHGGMRTFQMAPDVTNSKLAELIERNVFTDSGVNEKALREFVHQFLYGKELSNLGDQYLSNSWRKAVENFWVDDILRIANEAGDNIELASKMKSKIYSMYRQGSRAAYNNVGVKFDMGNRRAVQQAYNEGFDALNSTPERYTNIIVKTLMSLSYSNALGFVSRGTIQNLTETTVILQAAGIDVKSFFSTLKAMNPKEFDRAINKYGTSLGINRTQLDQMTGSEFQANFQRFISKTTYPFDLTQRMSVTMYIFAAESIGKKRGLKGADLDAFVIDYTHRLSIGQDIYSATGLQRTTAGRFGTMFWNWSMKDFARFGEMLRNAETPQAKLQVLAGMLGSKVLSYLLLGILGYQMSDAMNLNPFGVFDTYTHNINDGKDDFWDTVDFMMDRVPLPFMLSPIEDIYWGIREGSDRGQGSYDKETGEITYADAAGVNWGGVLGGFLWNYMPGGGAIERWSKTYEMYQEGGAFNADGTYIKFEAPDEGDVLDLISSIFAGPNATSKGAEYNGRYNPSYWLLTGDWDKVAKNLWQLQNDPMAQRIVGMIPGDQTFLEKLQAYYDQYNEQHGTTNAKPWRLLIDPTLPGATLDGGYGDTSKWSQEVKRLSMEHDNIAAGARAALEDSTNPYNTDAQKNRAIARYNQMTEHLAEGARSLLQAWTAQGHSIETTQANQIKKLMDFGEESAEQAYQEKAINYQRFGIPDTASGTVASQARSYLQSRLPEATANKLKEKISDNKKLNALRSKSYKEIDAIYDSKKTLSKADYAKITKIRKDYMDEFYKAFDEATGNNPGVIAYDEVADMIDSYVMIDSSEWTKGLNGRFISTKNNPNAKADIQKIIMKHYKIPEARFEATTGSSGGAELDRIRELVIDGKSDEAAKAATTLLNKGGLDVYAAAELKKYGAKQ